MVKITTALFWVAPFAFSPSVETTIADPDVLARAGRCRSPAPGRSRLDPPRRCDQGRLRRDRLADEQRPATWNFGTIAQRWTLTPGRGGVRAPICPRLPGASHCRSWLSRVRLAIADGQLRFWAWIVVTLIGPILVFFNLYFVHDYYAIASSGSVALLGRASASPACSIRGGLAGLSWSPGPSPVCGRVWSVQRPLLDTDVRPDRDPEGVLPLAAQIERETTAGPAGRDRRAGLDAGDPLLRPPLGLDVRAATSRSRCDRPASVLDGYCRLSMPLARCHRPLHPFGPAGAGSTSAQRDHRAGDQPHRAARVGP